MYYYSVHQQIFWAYSAAALKSGVTACLTGSTSYSKVAVRSKAYDLEKNIQLKIHVPSIETKHEHSFSPICQISVKIYQISDIFCLAPRVSSFSFCNLLKHPRALSAVLAKFIKGLGNEAAEILYDKKPSFVFFLFI